MTPCVRCFITSCLIALLGAPFASASDAPIARTVAGTIEGTRENGLEVYRGIPFAAPPVGELRWHKPMPAHPWDGTLNASTFGDACPQGRVTQGEFGDNISEDCLYLNVWVPPHTERELLPVMVWIHGGGFSFGATSTPLYRGDRLAERGVIVVSVAYRLGPFGFMAHPELSAESQREDGVHASGNYGLLDQIAGLQWVRDNISAFGGDPNKVTIFGESAGGISVSMLAASPLAAELFQRAISESGGSFGPSRTPSYPGENMPSLGDAELGGVALGHEVGASSLAEMRAADAATILESARDVAGVGWPIVDGRVIPGDQYVLYSNGQYNKTPVLIGINSDEGAYFRGSGSSSFDEMIGNRFGPFADPVREALLNGAGGSEKQAIRDLFTYAAFGWHTWAWANLQAETHGGPVYAYYFDQRPPYPDDHRLADAKGAPHAAELAYVFGHLDLYPLPWRASDHVISNAMIDYWTNFAKRGNPNGKDLPHWPAYKPGNPQRMIFSGEPAAGPYPASPQLKAFENYFEWRRTPEGKAFAAGK